MNAGAIRILLVDDHTLFREGLRRLLEGESGIEVSGDYASAGAALEGLAKGVAFDVALLDYDLATANGDLATANGDLAAAAGQSGNGLELLRQIRALKPEARVLFVTAGMRTADLVVAVRDLTAGIFLKTEPIAELLLAIQRTAMGERWVSSGVALALVSENQAQSAKETRRQQRLSERENLVLRGVLEGLSNKEIGARLNLTESSVKAVLQKLFEKTGVRSRSQLVRYAIEAQLAARD